MSDWNKLNKRRPPDSRAVLVQCYEGDSDWLQVAWFNGISWFDEYGMLHPKFVISHWMQLPCAPNDNEETL